MKRALILAFCVLVALAAPAEAKKKGKKVSFGPVRAVTAVGNAATGNAFATQPSTAVATCPKGTAAVGGGFQVTLTPTVKMAVEQSFRSSRGSWTVIGNSIEGTSAATAIAYCRKTTAKIVDAAATAVTAPVQPGPAAATATCPAGTRVISGGFQATRGPTSADIVTTETSMPSGNGWRVESIATNALPQTITAHAYCARKAKPKIVSASTTGNVVEDSSLSATSPTCPKAKKGGKKKKPRRMSGGGFQAPVGQSMGLVMLIAESRLDAGAWRMTGFSNNDDATATLASAGVCL